MWNQIQFTNSDRGQSICPICSHTRKPQHQKQKCLSWDRTTGIATCHHCGEIIYKDSKKEYTYEAPKVEYKPIEYAKTFYGNEAEPSNGLFKLISERYGIEATKEAFKLYKVRTDGANVFFHQCDCKGIRYIKQVRYQDNGKRSKDIGGIKSLTTSAQGNFKQCLFGLHLYDSSKHIHIVESEKTAIICHLEMPSKIWMATGGANNLKNVRALKKAILHPDKDQVGTWREWTERNGYLLDDTIEKLDLPPKSDLADAILGA